MTSLVASLSNYWATRHPRPIFTLTNIIKQTADISHAGWRVWMVAVWLTALRRAAANPVICNHRGFISPGDGEKKKKDAEKKKKKGDRHISKNIIIIFTSS